VKSGNNDVCSAVCRCVLTARMKFVEQKQLMSISFINQSACFCTEIWTTLMTLAKEEIIEGQRNLGMMGSQVIVFQ
jgi:hypothetical protein